MATLLCTEQPYRCGFYIVLTRPKVAYLALAETANTACDMYLVYQPLVQEFGKIEAITFFPKTLSASAMVTVLISTPVQVFMAWRISVIMGTKKVALVIVAFSLLAFTGGTWVTANVITLKTFAKKDTFEFNRPGVLWFVASAVTDVIITVTLVYTLVSALSVIIKRTSCQFPPSTNERLAIPRLPMPLTA